MSFQEVQTLEHFCRLLFEVTLHESYFGWAASMQFSPEVKGPPISLVWRNAYSFSVPIHRPACLSGLAPGQGLGLGSWRGRVAGFLKSEIWTMKAGCCGLPNSLEQARVEGFSCCRTAGLWFATQLHSRVPEQSTAKTPEARLAERKG